MKLTKRIKQAFRWYIQGHYHCDQCPYSWEERNYMEGDADAGCYIKGDICDSCRLLPPFRFLLGWPRKKKALYCEAHAYDDMVLWYEHQQKCEHAMREAMEKVLQGYELCWRDDAGKLLPACKQEVLDCAPIWQATQDYEGICHPICSPTLSQEWRQLVRKTWNKLLEKFKPYFS